MFILEETEKETSYFSEMSYKGHNSFNFEWVKDFVYGVAILGDKSSRVALKGFAGIHMSPSIFASDGYVTSMRRSPLGGP